MELVKEKGMGTPRALKPADNSPPHVSAELFVAITKVREAEERLLANKSQIEMLYEKTWAAQTALEDAEAAIEKAKETQLAYLASCDSSESPMTPRQARQKHVEAQESFEDIREARKFAEEAQKGLESELSWVRSSLEDRVADLVRSDPAVKRLCENFVTQSPVLADMRLALDFLRVRQALPAEFRLILCERYWPDLKGDKPWRDAFAALERDADAPLPEV